MSEELAVAASVTSPDEPVAVDPVAPNKTTVSPSEQSLGSADTELLKHKLGLANSHAKQARKEAEETRSEVVRLRQDLEAQKSLQQSVAQKNLEDQGAFKQLWEDAKKTVSQRDAEINDLKTQLSSVTEERSRDQLKAAALSQINTAGALNSQQMYLLLQSQLLTDNEGLPAVLNGGVEQPLSDYLANLKQSAEWQHHFGASGSRGMNAAGAVSVAPGRDNPYRKGNLTEVLRLEVESPELAKALKAEATKG